MIAKITKSLYRVVLNAASLSAMLFRSMRQQTLSFVCPEMIFFSQEDKL